MAVRAEVGQGEILGGLKRDCVYQLSFLTIEISCMCKQEQSMMQLNASLKSWK